MVWGPPPSLLMVKVAENDLTTVGVNATLIVQVPPLVASGLVVQLSVSWNAAGSAPPSTILEMVTPTLLLIFVNVIFLLTLVVFTGWGAKTSALVESFRIVPVPLRVIFCGLPPASSEMLTKADRGPKARGEKLMENVQLPPGARGVSVRQLSDS